MIYNSLSSVLWGAVLSAIVGSFFAILSAGIEALFYCLAIISGLPKAAIKASSDRSLIKEHWTSKMREDVSVGGTFLLIKDIAFSVLCGFFLSLLLYVAVDGEIRAYVFITVLASYTLAKRTLGKLVYELLKKVIRTVAMMLLLLLTVITVSARFVCGKMLFAFKKIKFLRLLSKTKSGTAK